MYKIVLCCIIKYTCRQKDSIWENASSLSFLELDVKIDTKLTSVCYEATTSSQLA